MNAVLIDQQFREIIVKELKRREWNQKEFAARLGVTPAMISQYLSGYRIAGPELMERMFCALDLEPRLTAVRKKSLASA